MKPGKQAISRAPYVRRRSKMKAQPLKMIEVLDSKKGTKTEKYLVSMKALEGMLSKVGRAVVKTEGMKRTIRMSF